MSANDLTMPDSLGLHARLCMCVLYVCVRMCHVWSLGPAGGAAQAPSSASSRSSPESCQERASRPAARGGESCTRRSAGCCIWHRRGRAGPARTAALVSGRRSRRAGLGMRPGPAPSQRPPEPGLNSTQRPSSGAPTGNFVTVTAPVVLRTPGGRHSRTGKLQPESASLSVRSREARVPPPPPNAAAPLELRLAVRRYREVEHAIHAITWHLAFHVTEGGPQR